VLRWRSNSAIDSSGKGWNRAVTAREDNNLHAGTDIDLAVSLGDSDRVADCPDIWMDPEVKTQIELFAATDVSKELAGVLLGELVTEGATPLVRVCAAIEAKHTEAVHTSVKFTHATWDDINRVKDEKYPAIRIVGWFHTHPGFGIFLSRWDMFIQENFFNLPWQVAYVVDPVNKTNGFFRWENGKIAQVGREGPRAEPIDVVLPPTERPGRAFPWAAVLSGALNVGLAAALVYLVFLRPAEVRIVEKKVAANTPRGVTVTPPAKPDEQRMWRDYTVKPGDSLWMIAEMEYGDGSFLEAIRKLNNLDEQDRLYPGVRLKLPCNELASALCGKTIISTESNVANSGAGLQKEQKRQ